MAKIKSYGGDFINSSPDQMRSGSPMKKTIGHRTDSFKLPEYPDSVQGVMAEQNRGVASQSRSKNVRNNRFS